MVLFYQKMVAFFCFPLLKLQLVQFILFGLFYWVSLLKICLSYAGFYFYFENGYHCFSSFSVDYTGFVTGYKTDCYRLTKEEFGEVLSGTFNCSDERCECCNYLLINDHYTFKNVQITFKLKNRFTCDSFNLIYVVICDTCKEEYIGETGEGKIKLRDRVSVSPTHSATIIPTIKS